MNDPHRELARGDVGPWRIRTIAHGTPSGLPVQRAVRVRHRIPPPAAAIHRGLASFIVLPVPLVGTLFLLPIIFMYRLAYYVSRGKVTSHVGYR